MKMLIEPHGLAILDKQVLVCREISGDLRARLREIRAALPSNYRSDLDGIRMFLKFGGLKNDPFAR